MDEKYSGVDIKPQKLGNRSINDYIFLPYPMLEKRGDPNSAVACHEFMHVLGAADAYSYETADEEFVGELDVMASGYGRETPGMPLSYVLYKIGFLSEGENIAPVLAPGEYTLFSTESGRGETKAYKLVLPDYETKRESFYVEYREKTGYGAGLSSGFEDGAFIVYRVNERLRPPRRRLRQGISRQRLRQAGNVRVQIQAKITFRRLLRKPARVGERYLSRGDFRSARLHFFRRKQERVRRDNLFRRDGNRRYGEFQKA